MKPVTSKDQLVQLVADIKVCKASPLNDWDFEIKVVEPVYRVPTVSISEATSNIPPPSLVGWLIQASFTRPDVYSGNVGRGYGRMELIPIDSHETAVVKTGWLLLELLVRHELMEGFEYQGKKPFDPHKTIEQLLK